MYLAFIALILKWGIVFIDNGGLHKKGQRAI